MYRIIPERLIKGADAWGTFRTQSLKKITDPKVYAALEKLLDCRIEQKSRATLEKTQQVYGVDVFGFGDAWHRKYPREWQALKDRWDEEFTSVKNTWKCFSHYQL